MLARLTAGKALDLESVRREQPLTPSAPRERADRGERGERPERSGERRPMAPPSEGRARCRTALGARDGVAAKNLLGAILNEGGLSREDIGRIQIRDTFSLIELPEANLEHPALTEGRRSAALRGRYAPVEALHRLLLGSGLELQQRSDGSYTLVPAATDGALELQSSLITAQAAGAETLPAEYAGGQVARGARLGMLGNADVMDAPFSITSYTARTIEQQQARSVADLLQARCTRTSRSPTRWTRTGGSAWPATS